MLKTNFPVIFPRTELEHLLNLELSKVRTAAEYYEEVANCCFAVGCLTRYFARRLIAESQLDPLSEEQATDYAVYIRDLVARPGADSTAEVFTPSEATYIMSYFNSIQGNIELPVAEEPAAEEPAAEEPAAEEPAA